MMRKMMKMKEHNSKVDKKSPMTKEITKKMIMKKDEHKNSYFLVNNR